MTARTKATMTLLPCALSIAGLDPGGGAGILADVRAFRAAGVFGCAAIAVVTAQSTSGLVSTRALRPDQVLAQLHEVYTHQDVRALKTGALGSRANVIAIARWMRKHRKLPLIVDPVMLASRSKTARASLLASSALAAMKRELLPCASIVTANASEAEALTSLRVRDAHEAEAAARAICAMGARAVLVKGGHLSDDDAIDVLVIGDRAIPLRAPRIPKLAVHGTGCALASLIAGRIAFVGRSAEDDLVAAVRWAKRKNHAELTRAVHVGGALDVLAW